MPVSRAILLRVLVAVLPAGFPAGCGRPAEGQVPAAGAAAPAVRVQTARPERADLLRRIALPGTVRADHEVKLHAKTTGYLKTITKDRGDRVTRDEVVAVLDLPELAPELESAQAALDLEDATLRRLEAIRAQERTAVTDQDLDVAKAKRAAAEASVKRWRTLLAYAEIRAPFDGIVTERYADPGALVQPQTGPVLRLLDIARVRIIVDVPEPEARFVAAGNVADVRLDGLPGRTVAAKVARSAPALDPVTRTLRTELEAENPDGSILPGMYAAVSLAQEKRPGALTVPPKAVVLDQGKPVVYVLADGAAHRTPVETGVDDGVRTEVTSGLKGGETVILPGKDPLRDGLRVEPEEEKKP